MADEVIANLGLDKKIQESVNNAAKFLQTPRKPKNPIYDVNYKKIQAEALVEFKKKSEDIKVSSLKNLNSYFQQKFTDVELKYLALASKYSVVSKLINVITDPEYVRITDQAYLVAVTNLKEAEKKNQLPKTGN